MSAPAMSGDHSSLDFLRAVYRDAAMPLSTRMRAAIAALPFEAPKLAVTATLSGRDGFGAQLEAAIARSRGKVIEMHAVAASSAPLGASR